MTGYGRATTRSPLGTITVELRSTNHRFLELEPRLPQGCTALQGRLTELVRQHLRRGRVEIVVLTQAGRWNHQIVTLNEPLLERYHAALTSLKGRFGLKGPITLEHLLSLPQAITVIEERPPVERSWEPIRQAAQHALRELVRSRQREGAVLVADVRAQLAAIERHVRAVKQWMPKALEQQRRQLRERVKHLLGPDVSPTPAQLEQVAALAREADIHEELVRIGSHLAYMRHALTDAQLVGKRLDFLAQELMRETNTMGAKVNDPHAAQHVVDIKGCIEKIREQVQNLE